MARLFSGTTMLTVVLVSGCTTQGQFSDTKHIAAKAGETIRVNQGWRSDANCTSTPSYFVVEQQPAHGTLSQRQEAFVVGESRVGTAHCAGVTVRGVVVYYTPDAGYQGHDRFGTLFPFLGIRNSFEVDVE
jgi:hypothetical protein